MLDFHKVEKKRREKEGNEKEERGMTKGAGFSHTQDDILQTRKKKKKINKITYHPLKKTA